MAVYEIRVLEVVKKKTGAIYVIRVIEIVHEKKRGDADADGAGGILNDDEDVDDATR